MTDPKQDNNDACTRVEVKSHALLILAIGGNKLCASRSCMTGDKMRQSFLKEAQLFHVDRQTDRKT